MLICPQCRNLYPNTEKFCARDNVELQSVFSVVGQDTSVPKTLYGGIIGNYRLLERLGEGGMGIVYEGLHLSLQRLVAIKVIHKEKAKDAESLERFFQEARAIAKVESEHIIQLLDFGCIQDGRPYLVMERLQGRPLPSATRLTIGRSISIAKQICRGLAAAHAQKIVHRDLKPDNVFLVSNHSTPDFVKLLDFGIAFQLPEQETTEEAKRLTSESHVMGTPLYMSPEQARGKVDSRTDIYAVGVLLYEMVTGKVPFDGNNSADILIKHLTQAPQPPSQRNAEISLVLEKTILKAMSKRVEDRYQTVEAMLTDLEEAEIIFNADKTQRDLVAYVREPGPFIVASQQQSPVKASRPSSYSRWRILLGLVVLLTSFLVGYWLISNE
jgi:eukaryotic-like serine/threonine-protein kinase